MNEPEALNGFSKETPQFREQISKIIMNLQEQFLDVKRHTRLTNESRLTNLTQTLMLTKDNNSLHRSMLTDDDHMQAELNNKTPRFVKGESAQK